MIKTKCPECSAEYEVYISHEQNIDALSGLSFHPPEGGMLSGEAMAKTIQSYCKLLQATADSVGDYKTEQFLHSVERLDDGGYKFMFLTSIAPKKKKGKRK